MAVLLSIWLVRIRRTGVDGPAFGQTSSSHAEPAISELEPGRIEGTVPDPRITASAQSTAAQATLVVVAVDDVKKLLLSNIQLVVARREVEGRKENPGQSLTTGEDGRAQFELPPGVEFLLSASGGKTEAGLAMLEVPALSSGERREVQIELPVGDPLHFFGRVLTEEDRIPVPGARVLLINASRLYQWSGKESWEGFWDQVALARRETGPDGLFDFWTAFWKIPLMKIGAPGFASVTMSAGPGHETPELAKVVLLQRAATLRARVLDSRGRPIADAFVRVGTEAFYLDQSDSDMPSQGTDPVWEERVDPAGLCVLEDLPPGVPLHAEVVGAHSVLKKELAPLELSPGEVREVEWRLGSGCNLEGGVVDQSGKLVIGGKIWLASCDIDAAKFFNTENIREGIEEAETNAEGRFAFADVNPGKWWLGPAPGRRDDDSHDPDAVAPFAEVVEIPEAVARQHVDLHVYRGLYIRGTVLDLADEPVPGSSVWVIPKARVIAIFAESGEDGSFVVGPLVPGQYQLVAHEGSHADSEPVVAAPGDNKVILRLRLGGSMRGVIVDSQTGKPCAGELVFGVRDSGDASSTKSETDGSFRIEGLEPGAYDIVARSSGQRVGLLRSVSVQAGVEMGNLVVELRPGATIRLRSEADDSHLICRIRSEGTVLAFETVRSGATTEVAVPPGRLSFAWSVEGKEPGPEEKEIEVRVGEVADVVLKRDN